VARIEALAPLEVDVDGVLGAIQAEGGDFSGAIETLQKARAREPNSTDILYNLGLAYYKSGDRVQAAQTLESSQRLKETGEVGNLLGQVYEDDGQYVKAARALQRAIELDPTNESYRFDFTLELLKHRSFDAAIAEAEKDVGDLPDSLRLRLILGVSYFGRGNYHNSVEAFLAAAKRFPAAELPLYCLAQAAGVTGEQTDEAQSMVSAYSQDHPVQAWPYCYLGQLAAQKGAAEAGGREMEKAEALLKKSIALDPSSAESHFQLGNVYSKLTEWPDASREYRKAIELKPSLAEAHYHLAEAYRHLGDAPNAEKELRIHQTLMEKQSEQSRRDQDLQTFIIRLTR
jgi:tetratricopeptide (TPR) repeat protein